MKNVRVYLTAIILFLSFVLTNCTPDSSMVPSTEELLIKNAWAVDYYFDVHDITNEFNNSTLLFSSTGSVGCQRNGEIIAGTWSKTLDASNNEVINISFNTSDPQIARLSEGWRLTNRSLDAFQFEKSSASNGIMFRIKTK